MSDDEYDEYDGELQPAPSDEVVIEGLRRMGRKFDDLDLDLQLRVAVARRDVLAAHGFDHAAGLWQRAAEAYADVRRERTETRAEFADVVSPVHVRPLTAEELAEVDWPEEAP